MHMCTGDGFEASAAYGGPLGDQAPLGLGVLERAERRHDVRQLERV